MHNVVLITVPSKKEAEKIAEELLKARLAACVNMVPGIVSLFWWQKKIDRADEILLIVKTKKTHVPRLIKKVKSLHSYEVPEIIAVPLSAGYKPYLSWINESLRKPS